VKPECNTPKGSRTPVPWLRTKYPGPLDDGGVRERPLGRSAVILGAEAGVSTLDRVEPAGAAEPAGADDTAHAGERFTDARPSLPRRNLVPFDDQFVALLPYRKHIISRPQADIHAIGAVAADGHQILQGKVLAAVDAQPAVDA
jgi:hypothetical protein